MTSRRSAAVVSFRLGGNDGVSVEAAKWCDALRRLDFDVRTVAGEGVADVVVDGLGRGSGRPAPAAVAAALEDVDVVVVENLLSLPLNAAAGEVVAGVLRGRPAVLRHHDLPWQRPELFPPNTPVPTDPRWCHVVVNSISRRELGDRGIAAEVLHNRFPLEGWRPAPAPPGPRSGGQPVLLHPVRAIARKDVPTAVRLAERMGAVYWLSGPAEDGYEGELDEVLRAARCPIRRDRFADSFAAYAEASAVAFPSTLEGFGNPVIESALARRPLAVRRYPVLVADLEPNGFRWFDPDDAAGLLRFLDDPDVDLLDHNEDIARTSFGIDRLPAELAAVLERVL